MTYKFQCENKDYADWKVLHSKDLTLVFDKKITQEQLVDHKNQEVIKQFNNFDPVSLKLLNGDRFDLMGDEGNINVKHSIIKSMKQIPGVLLLDKNQTYGRYNKRLLYRCIPDDKRMPEFLVPYEDKSKSFSKQKINKYVLFIVKEWIGKHPIAQLVNTIGSVDNLSNFYEYQLYCKSLYASIQDFTKQTIKKLRQRSEQEFIEEIKTRNNIEDRQEWNVFSIDPKRSKDFDDAFSIRTVSSEEDLMRGENTLLSVYIANVSLWMEAMGLWESFSERIATIYLPDQKRPMLPSVLSDCLCSLVEGEQRFAFTMDITLSEGEIKNIEFKNTLIKVSKNFRYEEKDLLESDDYKKMLSASGEIRKKFKTNYRVRDSHELVAFLMILMNYYSAKELTKRESGIYRSVKLTSDVRIPKGLPENVYRFVQGWNSSGGRYALFKDLERHDILELDSYVHITSPIRRLVDLLNILQLQHDIKLVPFTEKSKLFFSSWIDRIDYINTTMRSIRKVQCNCSILSVCMENPETLDKIYSGYVFDVVEREDKFYQMMVYLPEINMTTRYISAEKLDEYSERNFKLCMFKDEHNIKRKIRLAKVD